MSARSDLYFIAYSIEINNALITDDYRYLKNQETKKAVNEFSCKMTHKAALTKDNRYISISNCFKNAQAGRKTSGTVREKLIKKTNFDPKYP
jgi:hypothetical protein